MTVLLQLVKPSWGEPSRRRRGERSSHGGWGAQPHTKERAAARGRDVGGRLRRVFSPAFAGDTFDTLHACYAHMRLRVHAFFVIPFVNTFVELSTIAADLYWRGFADGGSRER